jgi:hypothetical protein
MEGSIIRATMAYDPQLDKEIGTREVVVADAVYIVALRSYNGGEPKVVISMKDSRFPVRRLTPDVFLKIADAVRELAPAAPAA